MALEVSGHGALADVTNESLAGLLVHVHHELCREQTLERRDGTLHFHDLTEVSDFH